MDATTKLKKLRDWIRSQPPSVPSYSQHPATAAQMQVGTLITSLSCIGKAYSDLCEYTSLTISLSAYLLNLRGSDIPHNPLFQAYLFVGLDSATIFLDAGKVIPDTTEYLNSLNIARRDYQDLWSFLRRREWGEGKVGDFRY